MWVWLFYEAGLTSTE